MIDMIDFVLLFFVVAAIWLAGGLLEKDESDEVAEWAA